MKVVNLVDTKIMKLLHNKITAVCPIDGILAEPNIPKSEWVIWFNDDASIEEKAAAQVVVDNFDWAAEEAALAAAEAAEATKVSEYEADQTRRDMVDRLMTATPDQIDTWLSNNVTNLAQARQALGMILKILALIVRRVK